MDTANLIFDAVACAGAFLWAAWRFRFAREMSMLPFLLGSVGIGLYIIPGTIGYLLGDSRYFIDRSYWLALGLGLVVYAAVSWTRGRSFDARRLKKARRIPR